VFLVSHDRRFLDNVVTSTIAWEGEETPGFWREYEGGYEDWKAQRARAESLRNKASKEAAKEANKDSGKSAKNSATPAAVKPRKLSYKEQRELDALPAKMQALETEQASLNALLADGAIYSSDPKKAAESQARVAQIDDELLAALERLEVLQG
jgi:ABC transport system ATP-binding/permease protein